jgi:hypothetical protein
MEPLEGTHHVKKQHLRNEMLSLSAGQARDPITVQTSCNLDTMLRLHHHGFNLADGHELLRSAGAGTGPRVRTSLDRRNICNPREPWPVANRDLSGGDAPDPDPDLDTGPGPDELEDDTGPDELDDDVQMGAMSSAMLQSLEAHDDDTVELDDARAGKKNFAVEDCAVYAATISRAPAAVGTETAKRRVDGNRRGGECPQRRRTRFPSRCTHAS